MTNNRGLFQAALILPLILFAACGEEPSDPATSSTTATPTSSSQESPTNSATLPPATNSQSQSPTAMDTPTGTAEISETPGSSTFEPTNTVTPQTTPTADGTSPTVTATPWNPTAPSPTDDLGTPAQGTEATPTQASDTGPTGTPGETGTPLLSTATPSLAPTQTQGENTASQGEVSATQAQTQSPEPSATLTLTPNDTAKPTPTQGEVTATPSVGQTPTDTLPTPTQPPETTAPITPTSPLPTAGNVENAARGDVIVTEFMPHPRRAADNLGEWFEVKNISDKTIDLDGWIVSLNWGDGLSDSFQITTDEGGLILPPRGRAVLSNNSNYFDNGNIDVDVELEEMTLDDSGFSLTIRQGALIIDALTYGSDFNALEGHSFTLDPSSEAEDSNDDGNNWCSSFTEIPESTDFGSPGQADAPCGVDADSDLYPTTHDCNDSNAQQNPGMPELSDNSLDDDCDGEVDESLAYEAGTVVINELMFDPDFPTDENAEWIEIYNTSPKEIDLEGWIVGNGSESHVIYRSLLLPANGYLVLGISDNYNTNGSVEVDYVLPGLMLQNQVGAVQIWADNAFIDTIYYDDTWPNTEGHSIALDPDSQDAELNDEASEWCVGKTFISSSSLNKGSPGIDNPVCGIDEDDDGFSPPEDCDDSEGDINPDEPEIPGNGVDENCDGNDFVDLDEDGYAATEDCDDSDANINPGAEENPGNGVDEDCDGLDCLDGDGDGYCPPDDCDDIDPQINPGESEVLGNDVDENCDGEAEELPDSVAFITEFCYRGINDVQPHVSEWIEIYNPGDSPLSVSGWTLSNDTGTFTIEESLAIPAGGYLMLGGGENSTQNGNVPVDVIYGNAIQLNNSSDTIMLLDSEGTELDIVPYEITDPWPPLTDRSTSIQLDPDAYNHALNDDGANWCLSSNVYNATTTGTPGADNLDCFFRTRLGQFD